MSGIGDVADTIGRRYEVLRPHLSELQRRLFLGAEAAELGAAGVGIVAGVAGVAADTVHRCRDELGGAVPAPGRSRKPGGGHKRAEDLDTDLEALIEPTTRGDPESPLRGRPFPPDPWRRRSRGRATGSATTSCVAC